MIKMPIRCSDFKELIDRGYYFVDKSEYIDDVVRTSSVPVFMTFITFIPRPHLFGKTLFLSMLDAYLNLRYANGPDRFEGLKISGIRPNDPHKNAHVVINVSLKDLGDGTYAVFRQKIAERIRQVYSDFPELLTSDRLDDYQREDFKEVINSDDFNIEYSLRNLCGMLERHYGMSPMMLVDDFDSILIDSCTRPYEYEKIVETMRPFLSTTFESNLSLSTLVVTGSMGVSLESFPDLDLMMEHGITGGRYDTVCGFTQGEVEDMLEAAGRPDRIDEVEEWYGGYCYGNSYLYNPWDVIRYVEKGFVPEPYWIRTLDNLPIINLLLLTERGVWSDLMVLLTGRTVRAEELGWVPYQFPLFFGYEILRIMAVAGYLGAVLNVPDVPDEEEWDDGYELYIPNREVFDTISDKVVERLDEYGGCIESCMNSMGSGVAEELAYKLGFTLSCLRGAIQDSEFPYEAFVVGLVAVARGRYEVRVEGHSEWECSVVLMIPSSEEDACIAMAVDRRRFENKDRTMKELAEDALERARNESREHGFPSGTILYGIAFKGLEPTVIKEILPRRAHVGWTPGQFSSSTAGVSSSGTASGSSASLRRFLRYISPTIAAAATNTSR